MIVPAHSLSLKRWVRVSGGKETLLRSLEHDRIAGIRLKGRILDIGGGIGFRYTQLLDVQGEIHSININRAVNPTIVADLNQPLPVQSATYDHVISFNTLEHVREDVALIGEILRVLKPGGSFLITVPFLFRIHGTPYDYHRHTAQWWEHAFTSLGVASSKLTIEPLVWGALSSALTQMRWFRAGLLGGSIKKLITLVEVWQPGEENYALGYVMSGTKQDMKD